MRNRLLFAALAAAALAVPASALTQLRGAVFVGDFDSGKTRPWMAQAANYGYQDNDVVHFGDINVDDQVVGQGRFSGRFTLPAWRGGKTRSQLITPRPVNAGGDDYYTLMFYVPHGWTAGTGSFWGVQIAQVNFESLGPGGPTVALQLHADHVTLVLQSGVTTKRFPYFQYRSNADSPGTPNVRPLYAIPRGMYTGVWHELVLHCHWAGDDTGVVEVWHRRKGQTKWKQTVSLHGVATLQTESDGSFPQRTLDDIQAYRGPSTAPVTVWLDGFARLTSLEAAQSALP